MSDITHILQAIKPGDPKAPDELLPLVYDELRKLAAYKWPANHSTRRCSPPRWSMKRGCGSRVKQCAVAWPRPFFCRGRRGNAPHTHYNARRKRALRHGGGQVRVDILEQDLAADAEDDQLIALNHALDRLAAQDGPKAELVKLRFFVGLTIEEAADILGISVATAKRHWIYARAGCIGNTSGSIAACV